MKRKLITFPKERYGLRSESTKVGVQMLDGRREKRELLILGTGRSGTTTIANVFQKMGYDLQRERVGAYGTASLYFVVDSAWHPRWTWEDRVHIGERRSDFKFNHVMHIVRNPAKTIPSMGAVFPSLNYEFFEDNGIIPMGIKSQMLRCAHAYFNINRLAEKQAEYRFQIEKLYSQPVQYRIQRALGWSGTREFPEIPVSNKATGYRKREPLDWGALSALDKTLCKNILNMAKRYGY